MVGIIIEYPLKNVNMIGDDYRFNQLKQLFFLNISDLLSLLLKTYSST